MQTWKQIPGAGLYFVSDDGLIAYKRTGAFVITKGRALISDGIDNIVELMKPTLRHNGYSHVWITYDDGKRKTRLMNRLVCEAFHGPPPKGLIYACHKDGDSTNNHAANLYWGTPSENIQDTIRHGRFNFGERCSYAKLTSRDVGSIRGKYSTGRYTQRQLSNEFGVAQGQISRIINGTRWAQTVMTQPGA